MDFGNEYLKIVKSRFESVKNLGDKTICQLTNEDINWKLNESSNSIATIAKHLSGNMVFLWSNFLTTDGERTLRNRDGEFEDDISSKQEMKISWNKGWMTLLDTLNELEGQDLLKKIKIRDEYHTVLEEIEKQMAHYAYHVGQIVFIGKQLKDEHWKTLSIPKGKSKEY